MKTSPPSAVRLRRLMFFVAGAALIHRVYQSFALALACLSATGFILPLTAAAQQTLSEALDNPELSWNYSRWWLGTNVTHDGTDAAESGEIYAAYNAPWLATTVVGPGTLTFWWKIDSPTNSVFVEFHIDDIRQPGRISGEMGWQFMTFTIASGIHSLRWTCNYLGPGSGQYLDRAWLDEVAYVYAPEPPTIVSQPKPQTNYATGTIRLDAAVSGGRPLAYQWRLNGTNLAEATNATLTLTNTALNQTGDYSLEVSNAFGATISSNTWVSVLPCLILYQPASQTIVTGRSALFTVGIAGAGPFQYQWQHNGGDIRDATNQHLILPSVEFVDGGFYNVTISNAFGVVTSASALLTVVPDVKLVERGRWYSPDRASGLDVSGNYAFVASRYSYSNGLSVFDVSDPAKPMLKGTSPRPLAAVEAAGGFAYSTGGGGAVVHDVADPSRPRVVGYRYSAGEEWVVKVLDRRLYWGSLSGLWVSDLASPTNPILLSCDCPVYGSLARDLQVVWPRAYLLRSDALEIYDVTNPRERPRLGTFAVSQAESLRIVNQTVYIAAGTNGLLILDARDPSSLAVIGRYGAGPARGVDVFGRHAYLAVGKALQVIDVNDPTATGWVTEVWMGDEVTAVKVGGRHVFVAGYGLTIFEGIPDAHQAPQIEHPPATRFAQVGGSASFSVSAVGDPPLSYQWRFNGNPLSNATNFVLKLTNVQTASTGDYDVVVANAAGTVTSSAAALGLIEAPAIIAQGADAPRLAISNQFSFAFNSQTGLAYVIEAADSFKTNSWYRWKTLVGDGEVQRIEVDPRWSSRRFFRVGVLE